MIVKDAQKEKSKLKSLEYHKKKLEEISQQPIKLPDQEIMKKISEKHKNQQAMLKFQKSEALLEQQRNNQVIINRLLNNYSSKPKTSQQPKREFRTQQYDKINEENRSLANRIMNLPPVVNMKRYEQEYTKHQSDLVIMQKYHQTVRLTDCQDDSYKILNELTNGKFAKSKFTNMTFTGHVNRMKRFVFFQVEELILFNQRHKYKGKNIAYFSWVIETNNKQIKKTPPLEFEQFETVLQDFLISDSFVGIQLNLLKMKQNEVFDMGYFLYSETQSHIETIGLKDHLVLRVSDYINDDIKKNINDETVKVGTIKYRMIQICKSRVQNTQVSQYQIQVQNHNE